jgi:integrase
VRAVLARALATSAVKSILAGPLCYLFVTPAKDGSVRGPWRGIKNRPREFVREVITDPRVLPNHAWRHLFKTIGMEAGIDGRVLDAMCGHAARTVGEAYGEATRTAMVRAMKRFPRFQLK